MVLGLLQPMDLILRPVTGRINRLRLWHFYDLLDPRVADPSAVGARGSRRRNSARSFRTSHLVSPALQQSGSQRTRQAIAEADVVRDDVAPGLPFATLGASAIGAAPQ